jgi:hypothetical protein
MSNMNIIGAKEASEKVLVFPKYKIVFDGTTTVDNTTGTKCSYGTGLNTATSCSVYYDNVVIPEIFSTSGT